MIKKLSVIFIFLLCLSMIASQNVVAANEVPTGQTSEENEDDQNKGITADVFGDKGGHFLKGRIKKRLQAG